jgi:hypothetical protein
MSVCKITYIHIGLGVEKVESLPLQTAGEEEATGLLVCVVTTDCHQKGKD